MTTPAPLSGKQARGRPIRFLVASLGLWIAIRTWMLWPAALVETPKQPAANTPDYVAAAATQPIRPLLTPPPLATDPAPTLSDDWRRLAPIAPPFKHPALTPAPEASSIAQAQPTIPTPLMAAPTPPPPAPAATPAPQPTPAPEPRAQRWRATAWLFTRNDAPAGVASLGGGQTGLRVTRRIDRRDRLALFARTSAPLRGLGREVAVGAQWQPAGPALRVIAEHRIDLDSQHPMGSGVQHAPALGLVAGTNDLPLPHGFTLESYGQAGGVWRHRVDPYADGAMRLSREIPLKSKLNLKLGIGAWGVAQREAARVDVGPTLVSHLSAGGRSMRLSIDWRTRVVGDASPGSGPAITLGSDF